MFLTHLHSDHVVGFPDLWLTGWLIAPGRTVPLQVWGPTGTADMMSHLREAYKYDITVRLENDRATPDGIALRIDEVREGVVHQLKAYAGPLEIGEDLMAIDIEDRVSILKPRK